MGVYDFIFQSKGLYPLVLLMHPLVVVCFNQEESSPCEFLFQIHPAEGVCSVPGLVVGRIGFQASEEVRLDVW